MTASKPLTLQNLLFDSAREYAERPALSMVGGTPVTYAGLLERARAVAAMLVARGVNRGDRVAILSENMPEWGIAYFGVVCMAAVAVPIMTEFQPAQIAHLLEHAGCAVVLVSARLRAKVDAAPGRTVIAIEELSALPSAFYEFPPVAEEDLAAIIYTSGTTGHSKGVMLTHRNIAFDAAATLQIVEVRPSDRLLSILTLAHTYECTLGLATVLMKGASVWYLDRPPSATALLPALKLVRPTIMLSVPLIIEKLYRARVQPELERMRLYRLPVFRTVLSLLAGRKLMASFGGRLRIFAIGGAGLAPDVEEFLRAARFPYAIGYGLTETSPLAAGAAPFRTRPRAAGPALPGVQVRISEPAPGSAEGEIQIKGPTVMRGYYRDEERTREAFTEDGWLSTGDLGTIDEDGWISIRGRLKTMILGASGENIYPEEIEAVINQSPMVDESLVYGDGTAVTALVQLKPDALATRATLMGAIQEGVTQAEHSIADLLERLKKEVNSKLASFSRVNRIELQEEPFERTPSQKIKRFLYPKRRTPG
jgi:long-chain acyl-CoA synthetase